MELQNPGPRCPWALQLQDITDELFYGQGNDTMTPISKLTAEILSVLW